MHHNDVYERIHDKLQGMNYPCVLVVYGPSRNYRTTYRCENCETFSISPVKDQDEAWALVSGANYHGHPSELEIYAIGQTVQEIKRQQ